MLSFNFRWWFLPRCIDKQSDGSYVFLHRDHKPIGFCTKDFVHYEDYPVAVRIRSLTPGVVKLLSCTGSPDTSRICLYDSSCNPDTSIKHMESYLAKLRLMMRKLKIEVDG